MTSTIDIAHRKLNLLTHRLHTLPVVVLMPHSRCNCRCLMCDIWKANHSKREISREELKPHLRVFRKFHVQQVVLSGGEALMHSNLWRLCRLLKRLPVRITLLSTGLLLARHAMEIIHWCDEVIVSLDGSRRIHDRIRNVPRAFERLMEGVKALKVRDSRFRVAGRCVLQRHNFFDLPGIIDTAREIGLDQISFLAVDVSSTAFNRPMGWGHTRVAEVALNCDEVREMARIVERVIIDYAVEFKSGFIAESPQKLRRIIQYFAALNGSAEFPPVICNAPWVSAVIEADGNVRPCFFHHSLGNIHDRPLDEILNSRSAIAFRRGLDMQRNPICRKCTCSLNLRTGGRR